MNTLYDAIVNRRSIRGYTDEQLTPKQRDDIIRGALLSPSSRNLQPWHLSTVQNRNLLEEMEQELVSYYRQEQPELFSEERAKEAHPIFYNAPTVFFISMAEEKGRMDVGIMAQSICLAASSMGLSSIILGLPRAAFYGEEETWSQRIGFPKGYQFGIAVAVGHGNAPPREREPDYSKATLIE